MRLRELANSGIRLPEIGFGTWNYRGGVDPLRAAIECGARLIDTAESYGTEEIVGEAIKGRRHQVFLATKVLPRNFRRRDLIAAAERSLRRLGTDHIDLYQLHWPNLAIPVEEPMRGMEELVDAGKVRFIGVSNFSVRDLVSAQAALSTQRIAANQVRYSLIERTIEGGLLQYCQKNGITVIAYSPLATGLGNIRVADPEGVLRKVAEASCKSNTSWKMWGPPAGKSSRSWHVYLKKECAIAVVDLLRSVHAGQSGGVCKCSATGSEFIWFQRRRAKRASCAPDGFS